MPQKCRRFAPSAARKTAGRRDGVPNEKALEYLSPNNRLPNPGNSAPARSQIERTAAVPKKQPLRKIGIPEIDKILCQHGSEPEGLLTTRQRILKFGGCAQDGRASG